MTRPEQKRNEQEWVEAMARVKAIKAKYGDEGGDRRDLAGSQKYADRVILLLAIAATVFAIALVLTGN
jgi:hypothetical protein